MQVNISQISDVKKQLDIRVPAEQVAKAIDKAYQKIGQKARLKGFRPGKVPRGVLEQHYRPDAEEDAIKELLNHSYPEALKQVDLQPIAQPEIKVSEFGPLQDLVYQALIEFRPTFEVNGYTGLSLKKESALVNEEDIQKALEDVAERMAQLIPPAAPRKAQSQDVVVIDYQGSMDGSSVDGLVAKDAMVELGKGHLLPEVEAALFEMGVGDKKQLPITYPEDWTDKRLAGRTVQYNLEIKDIKEKKLPEINDELAKDLGQFTSLAELKSKIKEDLEKNKERSVRNDVRTQVLKEVVAKNVFMVPDVMVNSELEHMLRLVLEDLKQRGLTPEQVGLTRETFIEKNKEEAEFRVKGALIFDEIAKKENITVSHEDVDQHIAQMATEAGQAPEAWKRYYEKNNMLSGVASVLLEEKILDFVLAQSKIKN